MIDTNARFVGVIALLGSATIALAEGATIQPGMWEMVSTNTIVDMPSAPPMVAKMLAGRSTTIRHCITEQEAAGGARDLIKARKSCTFDRYVLSGGKIDSAMTCSQDGSTMTATTTGTYTATTLNSTSRIVMKGPAPMTITTSPTGRRTGAC